MPEEPSDIWRDIQDQLRRALSASTYTIWIAPLRLRGLDGSTTVISAPDDKHRWITDRFTRVLQTAAAAVLGAETTVEVIRHSDPDHPPPTTTDGQGGAALNSATARPPGAAQATDAVNPKHTFDQFVIGAGNRMAHAAALAVAEQPGQAYNPLFLYGPPGLGKTHLLHSIANYVTAHGAGLGVRCATVEEFTNAFVRALQSGGVEAFKNHFRHTDVLLLDDVQFLESKVKTEEELFHTFNALYDSGAQLVLTSDRLPRDMDALEQRLRERFESGLVADIQPPDFATRMTILRKRARHDPVGPLDTPALELIADRVIDNVRSLEGALIRVVAFASLTRRPVDAGLVTEVLDDLEPPTLRGPTRSVRDIQQVTCEAFGLSLDELVSSSRAANLVWPRQVAMYLARQLTDATLPVIGRQFGGRNHSTVLHACRRAGERIASDPDASADVDGLSKLLSSTPPRPPRLRH